MKIIKYPDNNVLAILGNTSVYADGEYRFMKYCTMVNVEEGRLIYNYLTRALVLLTEAELNNLGDIKLFDFMYKWYFLVPPDFDEIKVINEIRTRCTIPIDDLYLDHPNTYTILTTTKCNARCFYCYEHNMQHKTHMTAETAEQVSNYIITHAPFKMPVQLRWFGGEPLFNMKVIDIITNNLRNAGIEYFSQFTSNGYLFSKDIVEKAKNLWNIRSVQITIDGTESVYNRVKNYINNPTISPYKQVLNNIAILLNNGVKVMIRLNIDIYNMNNLKELVVELCKRYGNHPNLFIYQWDIFDDEKLDKIRTPEENKLLFSTMLEIDNILENNGYFTGHIPEENFPVAQCMADDGKSVTISPNGDLGTCEHFVNTNFWGNIKDPDKKDFKELNIWREYIDNTKCELCKNCPLLIECVRPKHCKEMSYCDKYIKKRRNRQYQLGIIQMYMNNNDNFIQGYRKLKDNIY